MNKLFFVEAMLIAASIQVGNAQQPAPSAGPFFATLGTGTNDCRNDRNCEETIFMGMNHDGTCYGKILNKEILIPLQQNTAQKIYITWVLEEDPISPVKGERYEFTEQGIVIKKATPKDFDDVGHPVSSGRRKFKFRSVNDNQPNPRRFEYDAYVVRANASGVLCEIKDPTVVNKN